MPYTITRDWLISQGVCDNGLGWFDRHCPSGEASVTREFLRAVATKNPKWVMWLALRLLSDSEWAKYDAACDRLQNNYFEACADGSYFEVCAEAAIHALCLDD